MTLTSRDPGVLLLCQLDRSGLGSDGNPVFVQRLNQNLPHVLVVGVEVEDIPHHVGQTLVRKFLVRVQGEVAEEKRNKKGKRRVRRRWKMHDRAGGGVGGKKVNVTKKTLHVCVTIQLTVERINLFVFT